MRRTVVVGLRRALKGLGIACLCYAGIALVLALFENTLVFRPTVAAVDWLDKPVPEVRDIALTAADGTRIHAWYLPCPGATTAVLYTHGNAGNLSHRGPNMLEMRRVLDAAVLIVDYPGYGKSGGSPSEQGCYQAADAGYDWLVREGQFAPQDIVLYGCSLGGGVAIDLAARRNCRALVVLKSFTSLPDVAHLQFPWLPVRWLMRNRFPSVDKIALCRRPVLVAHSPGDDMIPFAHGRALYEAAGEPKLFVEFPHAGHNERLPADFFRTLESFLRETASRQPA